MPGAGDALRSVGVGAAPARTSSSDLVLAFFAYCASDDKNPVILIDETVFALSASDAPATAALRDLFALFTLVTQQQLYANVVSAASGFADSGRFEALRFSCDDVLARVVVARGGTP